MTIVITSLFFVSFFNVVGHEFLKKESIVSPPSPCTTFDRNLEPLDFVPNFSLQLYSE
ncbi:prepilin peptidase [Sporosarcina psychrophila]|uniref:prepilin peptidase n=1 Tax=Sporosarcina psychrophila TaxID=1476 RepID=UPI0009EE5409|nr:prepilin peptidase [Sporosarcina psychrophila]